MCVKLIEGLTGRFIQDPLKRREEEKKRRREEEKKRRREEEKTYRLACGCLMVITV